MILFPAFGGRFHTTRRPPPVQAEEKPELVWQICPATKRPVMVWTLPEPISLPLPLSA